MIRYLLLFYLIVLVGLTFVLPSWRVYKRTGINPFTFGSSDSAHDFVGRIFKLVFASLLTCGIVEFFGWQQVSLLFHPLTLPAWSSPAGSALLLTATLWISLAQWHMSDSWRIGIDEKNDTALIQHGLFSISRNPIFLGMQATLLGLFLLMPSVLTLLAAAVGWVCIQVQVRLEEAFLNAKHGERYQAYCRKVRRWL